jgi:hypothetical protein
MERSIEFMQRMRRSFGRSTQRDIAIAPAAEVSPIARSARE